MGCAEPPEIKGIIYYAMQMPKNAAGCASHYINVLLQ